MTIEERKVPPVALLVDGENVSPKWADGILKIVKRYGAPTVRRVYGKAEHIAEWAEYGFRLQATRPGKNSADLLLTVEAMNLALREAFATIIVVSSDSDFSYLAEHLRELGHHFIGMGETKAAQAFRAACSEFIELVEAASPALKKAPPVTKPWVRSKLDAKLETVISAQPDAAMGIPLVRLGHLMKGETVKAQTGKATWRAYLKEKPELFVIEGDGNAGRVRLKP